MTNKREGCLDFVLVLIIIALILAFLGCVLVWLPCRGWQVMVSDKQIRKLIGV